MRYNLKEVFAVIEKNMITKINYLIQLIRFVMWCCGIIKNICLSPFIRDKSLTNGTHSCQKAFFKHALVLHPDSNNSNSAVTIATVRMEY